MKVLVIDDVLRNPEMVRELLLTVAGVESAQVVDRPRAEVRDAEIDLVIVGSRWLTSAQELRARFPSAYILGRCSWSGDAAPLSFYPWGNELRDPTLPLTRLVEDWGKPSGNRLVASEEHIEGQGD